MIGSLQYDFFYFFDLNGVLGYSDLFFWPIELFWVAVRPDTIFEAYSYVQFHGILGVNLTFFGPYSAIFQLNLISTQIQLNFN